MLNELAIVIENKHEFDKKGELFQLGIPFPKGLVLDAKQLVLIDQQSLLPVGFSSQVLACWPCKSIKFLYISFVCDVDKSQRLEFGFVQKSDLNTEQQNILNSFSNEGKFLAEFKKGNALSLPIIKTMGAYANNSVFSADSALGLYSGKSTLANIQLEKSEQHKVDSSGFAHIIHKQTGCFNLDEHSSLQFMSNQEWLSEVGLLKWQFTLWNSNAATHPGGCWDLGDPGSVSFEALNLHIKPEYSFNTLWRLNSKDAFEKIESRFSITQTGSACPVASEGNENFNRNIHNNAQGEVPNYFNGCELRRAEQVEQLSIRASPEVLIQPGNTEQQGFGLALSLAEFWQNFPKAFSQEAGTVSLALFPKQASGELFELQAGERKTHTFYIQLTKQKEQLAWVNSPSSKSISPKWLASCSVFPFFPEAIDDKHADPLAPFIIQGIKGPEAFEAKREKIDEYGWRHFGDVYADHETLYQKPGELAFVSHYNNQYDAIYGFARQYAQTGDMRWFKLMDELAKHVADIDIYHTDQDRVEYNNGLFWHTDHYLDAQTCTHRTFSKHNNTSSTPGQTGGGPASEHCYTTGLLYHHWLTGNEHSKEAVLKLASWMIASHEGAKSFLAQVLSAKNKELPKLIARLKGQVTSPYLYPFTRGTGNFMVALIDAFQINHDDYYLYYLESVIKNTLHPQDDITMRNLQDIENTWSYVVLLQSLAKYLSLKEELGQLDKAYAYARQSFMHYAQWMLENETPYLSRTEILEFPNDTWGAQELRKVSIWVSASKYSEQNSQAFIDKANEMLSYIVTTLEKSPEKHFSRIQILLMQSYGPHLYCVDNGFVVSKPSSKVKEYDFGAAPRAKALKLAWLIVKKVILGLRYLSPANERNWIQTRRG